MERWLSGRKRLPAKELNPNRVPGVRIPVSPHCETEVDKYLVTGLSTSGVTKNGD